MLISNGNNLLIVNNSASYGYIGISIESSTSLRVTGNNCSHNNIGILVQLSTSIDIEENLMTANTTYGLEFNGGVASWVYRNNVATLNNSANYATSGGTNAGGNY